jgi:hypothetical protein
MQEQHTSRHMADPGPSPAPAKRSTRKAAETALAVKAESVHPDTPVSPFGGLDDPFGLLAGLDLGALSGAWPAGGIAAALAASGLAGDAVFAPPGVYPGAALAAPAAPAEAASGDCDACAQCGAQMCRGTNDLEYVCGGCGLVVEGDTAEPEDDDAPRAAPNTARLRIVGPNSNQLQPDLYRSSTGNTAATQKKQIYEEYCTYRALFIEAGGRALPLDACKLASDFYNEVQRQCVKRSQNKKAIMAACFYHACLEIGFSPSKAEIAAFMQLPNKGIARGANFVRSLVADGKMDVDINVDPCRPEITTLFAHLGFEGDAYAGLRAAVFDVVQTAIANNIGTSSILRSKVAGATFVVLRRCQDRELIPKPMGLQEFCQDRIRKNTVERFTRQLDGYHSYFEACYAQAGLDPSPPR